MVSEDRKHGWWQIHVASLPVLPVLLLGWPGDLSLTGTSDPRVEVSL